jgi:hypothetical protein
MSITTAAILTGVLSSRSAPPEECWVSSVKYTTTFNSLSNSWLKIILPFDAVLKQAPRPEDMWEAESTAPRILNLGTGWRIVASFTLLPLYLQVNCHR